MSIKLNFVKSFFYENANSLLAIDFQFNLLSIIKRY